MMTATNLFDAAHYHEVRKPLLEAKSLPAWCYTSQDFYQREVEQIFRRSWHLVGRVDELASPGQYLVFDIAGESIIVVRDEPGEIRAFANTCRHRGTRLLDGEGVCRAIICPYHAWTYGLDGRLVGLRGMEKTQGFKKADHALIPIRLQTWAGFLFVCLSQDTEDLSHWLGDLTEQFASYGFDEYGVVRRKAYDLRCNWKLYIENAMEDYHTPTVHRSSIGLQETVPLVTRGQWDAIHMESDKTTGVLAHEHTPFPHVSTLRGLPARGTFFTVIYPTTFFASTQDCMWWLQTIPAGPERTTVIQGSCFPKSTVARADFSEHVYKYYSRWDKSIPEDNAISERQQAGLRSSFSVQGRLSMHEPIVHAFANWILERTLDI